MRSALYSMVEEFSGLGKLNLLASFALFDNDPSKINALEDGFAAVTPDQIMKTANEWLRKENRTVVRRAAWCGGSDGSGQRNPLRPQATGHRPHALKSRVTSH
jgi:hypothetical protein